MAGKRLIDSELRCAGASRQETTHCGHWTMRFANGSFLGEAVV